MVKEGLRPKGRSSLNALYIAKKELRTYFSSPIAYVIMAAFLAFTGLLFIDSLSGPFREASMRQFFSGETSSGLFGDSINAAFVLLLLGPVLTMRLLAEESKLNAGPGFLVQPDSGHQHTHLHSDR